MTWRVDPDEHGIWLYPDNSDNPFALGPEEAWDLGDDLVVAATRILAQRGDSTTGVTITPPWLAEPRIIRWGAMTLLSCPHCTDDIPVDDKTLADIVTAAREHWLSKHKQEVADDDE